MSEAPPLRVLHLNTERGWRGGERQTLWLARALQAAGCTCLVGARSGSALAARARAVGLTLRSVAPLAPTDPIAALALRLTVRRDHIDVLHAHTGNAHTLAVLATLGTRTALVAAKRVDRPLHAGALTRWKFARTDRVIAVSPQVRATLVAGGVAPGRVTVVPDGVDLSRPMRPAPPERLAALGVRTAGPLVLLVAALVPTKDPVTFVRAVAAARAAGAPLEALVAGDGPLLDAVRKERGRLALDAVLHLAGWQEDTDELVAAADVVALSSTGEGQGSILLDAMQCGRPVVATRVGGVAEIVRDEETGLLVPPGDPAAFGAALARLCGDAALRERLGARGRAVAGDFSVERLAASTLAVYREVLSRRGAGG